MLGRCGRPHGVSVRDSGNQVAVHGNSLKVFQPLAANYLMRPIIHEVLSGVGVKLCLFLCGIIS